MNARLDNPVTEADPLLRGVLIASVAVSPGDVAADHYPCSAKPSPQPGCQSGCSGVQRRCPTPPEPDPGGYKVRT